MEFYSLIFARVVSINEAIAFLDLESFYGPDHSLILVAAYVEKSVMDILGLPLVLPR